jgi:TonB family protein
MRSIWAATIIIGLAAVGVAADQGPQAPRSGQAAVQVKDGDLVVIEGDAKIKLVRRREANVTAVFNPAERWVILMVDYARAGKPPDGGVDTDFSFQDVSEWPLGERWSGAVVIDEYTVASEMGGPTASLGLTTDNGLIQILGRTDAMLFRDPAAATVVSYRGSGRSVAGNRPVAETEPRLIAQASRNAQGVSRTPGNISSSISMTAQMSGGVEASPAPASGQPVRVGGNIRTPTKLVHVDAIMPEQARAAGVRGMVVLEATIAADGSVAQAKVLRSIALLDDAAVAAVKQWKYTPTLLNGIPVPVIITVTVTFQ